ncbi:hypothetical protein F4774DRAFT_196974 [Daldinia eschscholtzii]|nr:hypothetical protein F4774DRAFT_196974 [Daldinia eschscholtzii]
MNSIFYRPDLGLVSVNCPNRAFLISLMSIKCPGTWGLGPVERFLRSLGMREGLHVYQSNSNDPTQIAKARIAPHVQTEYSIHVPKVPRVWFIFLPAQSCVDALRHRSAATHVQSVACTVCMNFSFFFLGIAYAMFVIPSLLVHAKYALLPLINHEGIYSKPVYPIHSTLCLICTYYRIKREKKDLR